MFGQSIGFVSKWVNQRNGPQLPSVATFDLLVFLFWSVNVSFLGLVGR